MFSLSYLWYLIGEKRATCGRIRHCENSEDLKLELAFMTDNKEADQSTRERIRQTWVAREETS